MADRVKSTKETVSAYGKGRSRRWRWSARIWPAGATKSQQYRRQGFETQEAAADDMGRVLAALREGRSTTMAAAGVPADHARPSA